LPTVGPLTWELCALADQDVLETLGEREGASTIQLTRHAARIAELGVALDDEIVAAVSVGDVLLRCKSETWDDPVFNGRVNTRQIEARGDQETFKLSAADPMPQLETAIVMALNTAFDPDVYSYAEFAAAQQLTIMADLISAFAAGAGVAIGLTPSSVVRDLSFPAGSSVAEGLLSVTGLDNGPEFELTPTEASDGTIATFNGYHPRQGTDKSDTVVLQIGVSDDDNLVGLSFEEVFAGVCNYFLAIGDGEGVATKGGLEYPLHPAYIAEHAASIATYGKIARSDSLSGATAAANIEAYAKGIVSANAYPISSFSATLDPDTGPEFGPAGDCYMGDIITLQAALPEEEILLEGRIAGATLTEFENGDVEVDLDCEVLAASGVTGSATNVVVDAGDGTAPPPPEVPEVPEKKKKTKPTTKKKKKGKK
jgi:hypothetical protein